MRSMLLALLLAACSPTNEGDAVPPPGNLWRITDPSGCAEREVLETIAAAECSNYNQRPIVVDLGPVCLSWFLGIAGPYAVPGVESMTFACVW